MKLSKCTWILLIVLSTVSCKELATERPNVILIITDDQGYGDFSCYGNPWLKTPNMDKLAESGVNFRDFHVDPTCAPTRSALMTGRYSSRVGVWKTFKGRHHLREDEVTMADVFAANGYQTAIFGKWHLGDNYPFRPMDRGFSESLIHGGGVIGEAPDYWGNSYYDDTFFRNGKPEKTEGYCTDVWFREAKAFISEHKEDAFFVYLPLNSPHGPLHVPEKYVKPYLNNEEIPENRAWMYGMLASIDENIGSFHEFLEEKDLLENTILILMTDNGTAQGVSFRKDFLEVVNGYNAGMRGKKGTPYEGGHRAAFILNWPAGGYDPGTEVTRLTAHLDVLPTLMELAGLEYERPIDFDGRSFAPLLEDPNISDWPNRTLFVHHQIQFGVRNPDDRPVKYKDYAVMTEEWRMVGKELYDFKNDPGQEKNVAAEYPEVVEKLSASYEEWWDDIDDKFNDYCRTVIGSDLQEEVKLDCQFWHGELALYNQQHIRAAIQANGFWDIKTARAGSYRIALRRWPKELDLAMEETVPAPVLDPARSYLNDKAINTPSGIIKPVSARLRVGVFDKTVKVEPGQKQVVFKVDLPEGDLDLQTWLTDADGKEWGAYYVYIESVPIE